MNMRRVQQISESHCGPAVIEMLLDRLGIRCDQELISSAANAQETIEEEGTRIDELATATFRLAPETHFWYKFHSSIEDIQYILDRGYPVGVEWQGLFYDSEKEEKNHGFHGHYSIVTHIDQVKKTVTIRDPYVDYFHFDRVFPISTFIRRWWDTNDVIDPESNTIMIVEDVRALFFITPLTEHFPIELGFQKYSTNHSLLYTDKSE